MNEQNLTQEPAFVEGLVSIIVPVFNAENHIAACLESILAQTYPQIEVVVIIDGATDSSPDIVKRIAGEHAQVVVRWQKNAGLSAARNAAVVIARGEFLWFVDADDVIVPHGVETMVSSLRASKSDFAVTSYYRFDSARRFNPGEWILNAHRVDRKAATLVADPTILCSAIACNKLYRSSFWRAEGLRFPEGVVYEDQEVSTKAYIQARSFDVLHEQLYGWRAREDGTSITQQPATVSNVEDRFRSYKVSLDLLTQAGLTEAVRIRCLQYMNNDLNSGSTDLEKADAAVFAAYRLGLGAVASFLKDDDWLEISPRVGMLHWLVLRGRRMEAIDYLARGGKKRDHFSADWHRGRLLGQVPYWDDPDIGAPDWVLATVPSDIRLRHSIRRARWDASRNALVLSGWAELAGLAGPTHDATICVFLVNNGRRIPLEVRRYIDPDIADWSSSVVTDSMGGGFDVILYPDSLPYDAETSTYKLELSMSCRGVARMEQVHEVNRHGSAFHAARETSSSGVRVRLVAGGGPLEVEIFRVSYYLVSIVVLGHLICGVIQATSWANSDPTNVTISMKQGDRWTNVTSTLGFMGYGRWNFAISVSINPDTFAGTLFVRVKTINDKSFTLDWPWPGIAVPKSLGDIGLIVFRNKQGNVALTPQPASALCITRVELACDWVRFSGHLVGSKYLPDLLTLRTDKIVVSGAVKWSADQWQTILPLKVAQPGSDAITLPPGRYMLVASADSQNLGHIGSSAVPGPVKLYVSDKVKSQVPISVAGAGFRVRFELISAGDPSLIIESSQNEEVVR